MPTRWHAPPTRDLGGPQHYLYIQIWRMGLMMKLMGLADERMHAHGQPHNMRVIAKTPFGPDCGHPASPDAAGPLFHYYIRPAAQDHPPCPAQ